jgi:hypothetical protein
MSHGFETRNGADDPKPRIPVNPAASRVRAALRELQAALPLLKENALAADAYAAAGALRRLVGRLEDGGADEAPRA